MLSAIFIKFSFSMALCTSVILYLLLSILINMFRSSGFFNICTSLPFYLSFFNFVFGMRIYSSSMKFDFIIYGSSGRILTWQSKPATYYFRFEFSELHSLLWRLLHWIEQYGLLHLGHLYFLGLVLHITHIFSIILFLFIISIQYPKKVFLIFLILLK